MKHGEQITTRVFKKLFYVSYISLWNEYETLSCVRAVIALEVHHPGPGESRVEPEPARKGGSHPTHPLSYDLLYGHEVLWSSGEGEGTALVTAQPNGIQVSVRLHGNKNYR